MRRNGNAPDHNNNKRSILTIRSPQNNNNTSNHSNSIVQHQCSTSNSPASAIVNATTTTATTTTNNPFVHQSLSTNNNNQHHRHSHSSSNRAPLTFTNNNINNRISSNSNSSISSNTHHNTNQQSNIRPFHHHQHTNSSVGGSSSSSNSSSNRSGSTSSSLSSSTTLLANSDKYDDSQLSAIESDIHTPLIISAGPGSGKTRTLCGRIVHLLHKGVKAHEILTLTFSRSAAQEMEHRIDDMSLDLPGYDTQSIKVSTFHAFCLSVLHGNLETLDPNMKNFSIATRSQQLSFLKESILKFNYKITKGKELEPDDPLNEELMKKEDANWLLNWIAKQKCRGVLHTELSNHKNGFFYEYYASQLVSNRLIDFMDMILMTIDLFESNADLAAKYSNRYKFILVDEFQDLNPSQFKILMFLLTRHRNITIVGDDDQSIYGFRGGTSKLFAHFRSSFPDHIEKQLQINYRSTMSIVKASQSLIQYNRNRTKKYISTFNEVGDKIRIKGVHSTEEEVDFISGCIKTLVSNGSSYRDIAILSRLHKNALSKYEDEMKKRGIPFVRVRKKGFSDREIIRIILGYMSLTVNEFDDESFRKVVNTPSRGIGEAAQLYLENFKRESKRKSLLQALRHAEKTAYPRTRSAHKVNKKVQGALTKFLNLIDEFSDSSQKLSIKGLISVVADGIGCESFAEKSKNKEQKAREVKKKVMVRRGQTQNDDDDAEMEDIEIEYNVEENLTHLVNSAVQYTNERYDDSAAELMTVSERVDLLKAFIDVTRAEEDERELLEKQGDPDAITITTIHGAKGLEWKHCFIVRSNQGMMPIMYRGENDTDQEYDNKEEHFEEERRLFYVALSRAKKTSCITYVLANEKDRPSMFIEQIGREYVVTDQTEAANKSNLPSSRMFNPRGNPNPVQPSSVHQQPTLANQTAVIPQQKKQFKPVPLPSKFEGFTSRSNNSNPSPNQTVPARSFKPIEIPKKNIPSSTNTSITTVHTLRTPKQENSTIRTFTRVSPPPRPANPPPSRSFDTQLHTQEASQRKRPPSSSRDLSEGFLFDDLDDLFGEVPTQDRKRQKTYL